MDCVRQIVTGLGFVVIFNEALVCRTPPWPSTDHDQTHNVRKKERQA